MNNRDTGGEVYGRGDQENARVLRTPNDIEFSGERKRVRCNEGLGVRSCRSRGEASSYSLGPVERRVEALTTQ